MKVRLHLSSWLRERAGALCCARPTSPGLLAIPAQGWDWLKSRWQHGKNLLKRHPLLGGGLIISLTLLLSGTLWYVWCLTPAQERGAAKIIVTIPYGASLREVGRDLRAKGLIHNELGFELYVRLGHPEMQLKAGRYLFPAAMPLREIVSRLNRGAVAVNKVTFPEGLTVGEVTELLARRGLIRKERFLALLKDKQWIQSRFSGGFDTGSWPEGYLFPDTYQFQEGATEAEIITMMLKRFEEVFMAHFSSLPADRRRRIVIIASLVEKEAKRSEERAIIAGVFNNRLRRDYPLQSCATVEYALGTHKTRLSYQDIKINSPYNTYEHFGLPPGPIANPGLASLIAAVHPAEVDYLYFVAKHDGGHVFSETYAEHLRAQNRINRDHDL